jgi:hypothetical protein
MSLIGVVERPGWQRLAMLSVISAPGRPDRSHMRSGLSIGEGGKGAIRQKPARGICASAHERVTARECEIWLLNAYAKGA